MNTPPDRTRHERIGPHSRMGLAHKGQRRIDWRRDHQRSSSTGSSRMFSRGNIGGRLIGLIRGLMFETNFL